MKAINTIPREEYAQMLFEAVRIIRKHLSRLADEETAKSRTADNKGDEDEALRHHFRAEVLNMAANYLTKSPTEFGKILKH